MNEPEYESVEEFAQFLLEDEEETFTHIDLRKLVEHTGKDRTIIRRELETYGYKLKVRPKPKNCRGFSARS